MITRILIILACNNAYFQNSDGTQTALTNWNTCRYDDKAYIVEEVRKAKKEGERLRRARARAKLRRVRAVLRKIRLAKCRKMRIPCR